MTDKRYTAEEIKQFALFRETHDGRRSGQVLDEILRQAAEDCEDAERFRFVREHTKAIEHYFGCDYHEIDAVVDAARTQEKANG